MKKCNQFKRIKRGNYVNYRLKKKVVDVKLVYKTKYKPNGEAEKYKARLVAMGYTQEFGIDYEEVFSLVARIDSMRIFLSIAAHKRWLIFQLDVKSAFLNGKIEKEVYVAQPRGFEILGQHMKVYKLEKALYGLKQAPRAWYGRLDALFTVQGFQKSVTEYTLYRKLEDDEKVSCCCVSM